MMERLERSIIRIALRLNEVQAFVRQTYPHAMEVITTDQIWIQSSAGGLSISRTYSRRLYGQDCQRLAWESVDLFHSWHMSEELRQPERVKRYTPRPAIRSWIAGSARRVGEPIHRRNPPNDASSQTETLRMSND